MKLPAARTEQLAHSRAAVDSLSTAYLSLSGAVCLVVLGGLGVKAVAQTARNDAPQKTTSLAAFRKPRDETGYVPENSDEERKRAKAQLSVWFKQITKLNRNDDYSVGEEAAPSSGDDNISTESSLSD